MSQVGLAQRVKQNNASPQRVGPGELVAVEARSTIVSVRPLLQKRKTLETSQRN